MKSKKDLKPKFCKVLKKNKGAICQTCEEIGITRKTFNVWAKEDEEFKEKTEFIIDLTTEHFQKNMMELADGQVEQDKYHFPSLKCIVSTRLFRRFERERKEEEKESTNLSEFIDYDRTSNNST